MEFQLIRFDNREQVEYTFVAGAEGVEVARFRKQILKRGTFLHPQDPNKTIVFDDKYFEEIIRAFTEGAVDNVPVITDTHEESYVNTVGRALELEIAPKGLYAVVELADQPLIAKIKPTLSDKKGVVDEVSVAVSSYQKDDGTVYPHVLKHISIVPHAFFRGMDSFEQIAAAVVDKLEKDGVIIISNKEVDPMAVMTEQEILAALKEKGIDVSSLESLKPKSTEEIEAAVVSRIMSAVAPDKSANDSSDVIKAINAMQESFEAKNKATSDKFDALLLKYEDDKANTAVDALVAEGKVVPADKDHYIKLFKTDETLFASITSGLEKKVDDSQKGKNGGVDDIDPDSMDGNTMDSELKRLKGRAKDQNEGGKKN